MTERPIVGAFRAMLRATAEERARQADDDARRAMADSLGVDIETRRAPDILDGWFVFLRCRTVTHITTNLRFHVPPFSTREYSIMLEEIGATAARMREAEREYLRKQSLWPVAFEYDDQPGTLEFLHG